MYQIIQDAMKTFFGIDYDFGIDYEEEIYFKIFHNLSFYDKEFLCNKCWFNVSLNSRYFNKISIEDIKVFKSL